LKSPVIHLLIAALLFLSAGCSSYQPTKNIWKSTKSFWNSYVSPPASVDYGDKPNLGPLATALSSSMLGVDMELTKFERIMQNADKPPTRAWISSLLTTFPWLEGFAGVKYDGTILGTEPAVPLKKLDYNYLLYEDKRQNSRALRGDVQQTPAGPEVIVATPIYDSTDFLGLVAANFDMRTLMTYSSGAENIVVLTPFALLWPGKYDYASTPLSQVDWGETVIQSSQGTCTNATGTFYYIVRYLANLPLIFAVPASGEFPNGNGDVNQGLQFFPEREKLPPPPMPERKPREDAMAPPAPEPPAPVVMPAEPPARQAGRPVPPAVQPSGRSTREIEPGSRDSMLLRKQAPARRKMEERELGEGAPEPLPEAPPETPQESQRRRPAPRTEMPSTAPERLPPPPPLQRPSPFGPADGQQEPPRQESPKRTQEQPAEQSEKPKETPKQPTLLPSGRPSPFGPSDAPSLSKDFQGGEKPAQKGQSEDSGNQ
jgi:hypothetical protein